MIDSKLAAKLAPLQSNLEVTHIYLIRRRNYSGQKVRCYSPPFSWLLVAEAWRLGATFLIALFKRPDALIAFGTWPHGVYAWIVGTVLHIPVIQHVMGKNDIRSTFPAQWGRSLAFFVISRGALIAVRGHRMKKLLTEKGVHPNKIFIPQNVHDFNLFRPRNDVIPNFDLIYVGLIEPYKRLDLLLDAFYSVLRIRPETKLRIVGDGSKRLDLEEYTRRLKISDRVCFSGVQPSYSLPDIFQDARVFVMTSQGEGLPQALVEAFSCGLPAVIPDDADIGEIAIDQINALLVSQQTPTDFADAIVRLLTDLTLYENLRAGALKIRDQRREEYSVTYQCQLWQDQLRRICFS